MGGLGEQAEETWIHLLPQQKVSGWSPAALVAIVLCVTTVSVIDLYCRWDNEKAQEWFSTGTESLWRGRAACGESASVLYCQGLMIILWMFGFSIALITCDSWI